MNFSKEQGYRPLSQTEQSDSNPEADSPRRHQDPPRFKLLFYILLTINVIAILPLGAGLLWRRLPLTAAYEEPFAQVFPLLSTEIMLFTPNESFYSVLDSDHQRAWDSLIPYGSGFVRIDNPQHYGLSGGYPLESTTPGVRSESYCVSAFHQLHCLNSIKHQLENPGQPHQGHTDDQLNPHASELHVAHCLDYLRQSIMCCGDMSLESAVMGEDGNLQQAVNGWGVKHECKAWDEVFEYTERINTWGKRKGG